MTSPAPYPPVDGSQPCAQGDPERFFSSDPRPAIQACAGCPFKTPCLAYAITHAVRGVWGGTTGPTRAAIRRRHNIEAVRLELSDTHTRIEEVRRLTANGLSAAEIADRTGLARRSATRIRGYETA